MHLKPSDIHGLDTAVEITNRIEYDWNRNQEDDKFCHLAKQTAIDEK